MWQQLSLILLIALTIHVNYIRAECKRYDNWRLYEITPNKKDQLDILKYLDNPSNSLFFVKPVYAVGTKIQAIVAPNRFADFKATLGDEAKAPYVLVNKNVQSSVDSGQLKLDCIEVQKGYTWTEYHELEVTYNWLRQLAKKYPKQVRTFVAGKSYEGRELLGIKISYGNQAKRSANKRHSIFIEGGMHAREWISPAVTTHTINALLTSTDKNIRKIAENYNWYIVPHVNPDGYVYTRTTDRLWRKTRKPYGKCVGADPNRNWGHHWFEGGSSNDSCEDTYAGPERFSEIEIRSLSQFLTTIKDELLLYLSLHSYGQVLLYPYAYSKKLPPTNNNLKRVGDAAMAGIAKRFGTVYVGGNTYTASSISSGDSLDWTYGELKVPYSYCYEMRPEGDVPWNGFVLPASQIVPASEELVDSVIDVLAEIEKIGGN